MVKLFLESNLDFLMFHEILTGSREPCSFYDRLTSCLKYVHGLQSSFGANLLAKTILTGCANSPCEMIMPENNSSINRSNVCTRKYCTKTVAIKTTFL